MSIGLGISFIVGSISHFFTRIGAGFLPVISKEQSGQHFLNIG